MFLTRHAYAPEEIPGLLHEPQQRALHEPGGGECLLLHSLHGWDADDVAQPGT
jgi:hypothetical protein